MNGLRNFELLEPPFDLTLLPRSAHATLYSCHECLDISDAASQVLLRLAALCEANDHRERASFDV